MYKCFVVTSKFYFPHAIYGSKTTKESHIEPLRGSGVGNVWGFFYSHWTPSASVESGNPERVECE